MSDIIIRKPLLVDMSKYQGYYKGVFPYSLVGESQPDSLVINLNCVVLIRISDYYSSDEICSLIFEMINKDSVCVSFENKKTRDAAFQDLSKYFN